MEDEIEFPNLPEPRTDTLDSYPTKIDRDEFDPGGDFRDKDGIKIANSEFQSESRYPVQLEAEKLSVTEADLDVYKLESVEKKVLISELADCGMYLNNIHKAFAYAGSTNALIKLVGAGIGVHRHRRQIMKDLKSAPKTLDLEIDEKGNLIQD